jgi:hypothetical protein
MDYGHVATRTRGGGGVEKIGQEYFAQAAAEKREIIRTNVINSLY